MCFSINHKHRHKEKTYQFFTFSSFSTIPHIPRHVSPARGISFEHSSVITVLDSPNTISIKKKKDVPPPWAHTCEEKIKLSGSKPPVRRIVSIEEVDNKDNQAFNEKDGSFALTSTRVATSNTSNHYITIPDHVVKSYHGHAIQGE